MSISERNAKDLLRLLPGASSCNPYRGDNSKSVPDANQNAVFKISGDNNMGTVKQKEIIEKRSYLDSNDDSAIMKYREDIISLLNKDINRSMIFFEKIVRTKNTCVLVKFLKILYLKLRAAKC